MKPKTKRVGAVSGGEVDGHLFHVIRDRQFGGHRCFLCGCRLNKKNRADEHVIPKWAQTRFSLYNQRLILLNGTTIPYRELTIPCCRECNGKHLKPLEDKMAAATLKGPSAVASLGELTLFLWLGKIFYGLLYKELFLMRDRASKSKKSIVTKKILKQFDLHQVFLQAARLPMKFIPDLPASIFVFRMAQIKDKRLQWDFRDSPILMTVACRVGKTAILAALQDGGAQRDCKAMAWKKYKRLHLRPLHFAELTAAFFYYARLMNRTPKFMVIDSGDKTPTHVVQNPLQGFSMKPIFDEWNPTEFERVLAGITGFPFESVCNPGKGVASWLHDEAGKVKLKPVPNLILNQLRLA